MTRTSTRLATLTGAALAATFLLLVAGTARADAAQVEAGAAVVDASWHVGASAGQYAGDCVTDNAEGSSADSTCAFGVDPADGTYDPTVHSYRRKKSYGLQSRLDVRALVVRGEGSAVAIVKTNQYIPQDLLYRRAAQLLEARSDACGVTRGTLTMASTHNHSSPMYSSTAWGVWAFQDVFDIRFYNYLAGRIADAVAAACQKLVPVRVGASVGGFDKTHRHSFGPAIADDGTPAGYPNSETDHDMTVIRFDNAVTGQPVANLVNFSLHPEFLEGNDLLSADYIAPLERITDRATKAITIFTQGAVGTAEPERSTYHSIHERLEFTHKDYAQAEYGASLMSKAIVDIWDDIAAGTPADADRFVPFGTDFPVQMSDRWYPGPLSHPYPGVSNCRADKALAGDPHLPIVGLPDCQGLEGGLRNVTDAIPGEEEVVNNPETEPGLDTDDFQQLGIPVPENYSAPSYTGLEEDINVHLQGIRLGEIYLPICSCEQWFDQSRNIETRTDKVQGNEWVGYDWAAQCQANDDGTYVEFGTRGEGGTGTWSCPNPNNTSQTLPPVSDHKYRRLRAQVNNPANGWNDPNYVLQAESEPFDTTKIKGNFTHDDDADSATDGYTLTVPISMANDYNGYIASYREYQRGDHYRKALTGWGPHSSDYMASRLVTIGRQLKDPNDPLPADQKFEQEVLFAKVNADLEVNNQRATALGDVGTEAIEAYEATLPDDGGSAEVVGEPEDIERFDTAFFTWNGGSNYTDDPRVRVEREVRPGVWQEWADQSGELPVTLEFPTADTVPAYLSGDQEWHWTAHFEAFVAPFDVGRPGRATPAGTYRFAVDGDRREGGAPAPYELVSETFEVKPWRGITAEDLRVDPDGRVSFRVGPRHTVEAAAGVSDEIGPIDYPDSYDDPRKARFVREKRTAVLDPSDPTNPNLIEWYCFTCSFRPWLDVGNAQSATFVFQDRVTGARTRVPARQQAGRWYATRLLRPREAAFVPPAGISDRYGNVNGERSGIVRRGGTAPPPEQRTIRAGAATADITPPIGTPMFAYTARSQVADPPQSPDALMQLIADPAPDENLYAKSFEPSEGIHTRLRASAIVVEHNDERFALAQADLGGVPYALVQAVEERLASAGTGIDGENLILSATHTHSATGPIWPADNMGYAMLGGDFFDPRVFAITVDGIAEAIIDAARRLEPARVGIGTTELRGASNNRNSVPFQRNPEAAGGAESVNPELTVLRVDSIARKPIALWSNFAIHPTSFGDSNLYFSGDNVATTERLVERRVAAEGGGELPVPGAPGEGGGPTLVWTNGAEGDVSPNGGSRNPDGLAGEPLEYTNSSAASANLAGQKVADGILDAWRDAGDEMRAELALESEQTMIALDGTAADGEPVGPIEALGAGGIVADDGTCLPGGLSVPGQGAKMPIVAGVGLVPSTASISVLRLGELGIAAMPFEITTQMGRRITGAVEGGSAGRLDSTVIAGLSDGYLSYTATPEEYDACHYEGSFTIFGRQQGGRLRDVAVSLLPALLDGGAAPAGAPAPPPLGFELPNPPALEPTPDAGAVVTEPADVRRYGRVTFAWTGGDPSVDSPRGEAFVSLQRREDGAWRTVGTEDGPEDTTAWDDDAGTWTETWQFSECDSLGDYRFVVEGAAVREPGGDPEPYTVASDEFELTATEPLEVIDSAVDGGTARVRARYPNPGEALLALPRRVRSGSATISLAGGGEVTAQPDADRLGFEASVPAGASIADVAVTDGCGNSTG